jgi:hypothetical protein
MAKLTPELRDPVVVLAQSKTQLNELKRAAMLLHRSGRYDVTLCLDISSSEVRAQMTEICTNAGLPTVALSDFDGDHAPCISRRRRLRNFIVLTLVNWLRQPATGRGRIARWIIGWDGTDSELLSDISTFELCWRNEAREIDKAGSLIAKYKPLLLLIGEDGLGGNGALIAMAREVGIAVIVVPYEYSSRQQILHSIVGTPEAKRERLILRSADRLVQRNFPKWVTVHDTVAIARLPIPIILSKEAHGLAPRNPWTVHGGWADKVAVESQVMLNHYRREGLPDKKLELVGSLATDDLYNAMRRDPDALKAFDLGGKRMPDSISVLCAIPPNYVGFGARHCEFSSFQSMVDFWIDALSSVPGAQITFQLHPGMAIRDADYVRSRVPVSDADIANLIAGCDVLVTSVSSIIRLAIACRKPTVNYDVYGFSYPDFARAPGVLNVAKREDFVRAIKGLLTDETEYREAQAALAASSAKWGVPDGEAGTRLLNLVDRQIARSRSKLRRTAVWYLNGMKSMIGTGVRAHFQRLLGRTLNIKVVRLQSFERLGPIHKQLSHNYYRSRRLC